MPIILSGLSNASQPKILADNRLADATPTASTTATGYAVANLSDWRPYTWWKPTALPATVTVNCGGSKSADYLFIAGGHNLFSSGCTVQVRGSTDNFASSDDLVASTTPTSDEGAVFLSFASVGYPYWRLRITGSTAPSLAVVAIGEAVTLPTYLQLGFDPIGRRLVGDTNRNSRGQVLGTVFDFEEWQGDVELVGLSRAWLRSTWVPLWRTIRSRPFGFAWDGENFPAETRLVTIGGEYEAGHESGNRCNLTFGLRGVA